MSRRSAKSVFTRSALYGAVLLSISGTLHAQQDAASAAEQAPQVEEIMIWGQQLGQRSDLSHPASVLTQADLQSINIATTEDIVALRGYMTDLHNQVLALSREGMNWDQLWRNVTAGNEYRDEWFGYEYMRGANIGGMFRWVDNHRRGVW